MQYPELVDWLDEHRGELLSIPGVLGVGIGKARGGGYCLLVNAMADVRPDIIPSSRPCPIEFIYSSEIKPME